MPDVFALHCRGRQNMDRFKNVELGVPGSVPAD
jgi:hypothetical protein